MNSPNNNHRLRRIASLLCGIAIGWLLCECLVQVLVPRPIFYSTWFTAGVHQPDQQFGFVLRPNYQGAMRNADLVWMEKIALDSRGFRLPASRVIDREAEADEQKPRKIVMLGGASMAFCYGLSDLETIHHQLADRLAKPCQIELVSWPGFTLGQDVAKMERFTKPDEFDLGVILAYGERDYHDIADWDALAPATDIHMTNSVVTPDDPAARWGGRFYYRSVVFAGLCRSSRVPVQLAQRALAKLGWTTEGDIASSAPEGSNEVATSRMQINMAAKRLVDLGVDRVLIVGLPHQSRVVGPANLSTPVSQCSIVDLRTLPDQVSFDWIAFGHYGPASASHLADEIAGAIASIQ